MSIDETVQHLGASANAAVEVERVAEQILVLLARAEEMSGAGDFITVHALVTVAGVTLRAMAARDGVSGAAVAEVVNDLVLRLAGAAGGQVVTVER